MCDKEAEFTVIGESTLKVANRNEDEYNGRVCAEHLPSVITVGQHTIYRLMPHSGTCQFREVHVFVFDVLSDDGFGKGYSGYIEASTEEWAKERATGKLKIGFHLGAVHHINAHCRPPHVAYYEES